MQFTTGPFLAQRGLLAAEAPVDAVIPGGAFTTGSVGPLTNVGLAVTNNQYETHRAVDPANPLKQAVCGKWKASEKDAFVTWTTDGWATQQSYTWAAGDPVLSYAVNGDLVLTYIPKTGNTQLSTIVNPGGNSTFGAQITMGIPRDRPWINVCRAGPYAGRIYVSSTSGNNATYPYSSCFWSDDHGRTWSRSNVMLAQATTGVYPDGRNAAASSLTFLTDGTVVFTHATAPMTSVSGSDAGYPYAAFAQRSLDGGATWNTPVQIDDNGGIPVAAKGGQSFNNVTSDGTRLYFFFTRRNENPVRGYLRTSDDGGLTWSARRVVITPPTGYGCNQVAAACNDKVLVVQYHVIAGQWPFGSNPYRVFTMWSFDRGATFSTPVETTPAPVPWKMATSTSVGAGQQRDAGEDNTGIMAFGNKAYCVFAQGTANNLYYAHIYDITFS